MKVSEELSISFWLRKSEDKMLNKRAIMVEIIIRGMPSDGFSLGYQVEPEKFDRKAGVIIGRSAEVSEINNHILHVRSELLRYYNLLKAEDPIVMPTMIKHAYKKIGVRHEQKTLLQVFDYHYEKFESKVTEGKRSAATLKKWKTTRDKVRQFLLNVRTAFINTQKVDSYNEELWLTTQDFILLVKSVLKMTLRILRNIMVAILVKQPPDNKKLRNYYLFEFDRIEIVLCFKSTYIYQHS